MRRAFVEIENGVGVAVHDVETRGNRGNDAANPRTPIQRRKPQNEVRPNQHANKGDVVRNGKLMRKLEKRESN